MYITLSLPKQQISYNESMKKKHHSFLSSPILIMLLVFILPPLGLILIGNHSKLSISVKILSGIVASIFVLLFFFQYQWQPRSKIVEKPLNVQFSYQFQGYSFPELVLSSLDNMIPAPDDGRFVRIDYTITNLSDIPSFYISLLENPLLMTEAKEYVPDLTLSREPFGTIEPKQNMEGYLIFQVPANEIPQYFKIAGKEYPLLP